MAEGDLLFAEHNLRDVLEAHNQKMIQEIETMEENSFLNTSVDDLCDYFEKEYHIAVPKLMEDQITTDQVEADVDVSGDPHRGIFDRSRPFYIRGSEVTFFVPFDGDSMLLRCCPSSFTLNPPRAVVGNDEILFMYSTTSPNTRVIKTAFDEDLSALRKHLEWVGKDVARVNDSLRKMARERIEARRARLLQNREMQAALGFPMRRREGEPQTYVTPEVRRKPKISRPTAPSTPYKPEPVLEMDEYEHILSVVQNMVAVMERSPKAFQGMAEEDLRQHFLVQLNGHYEGQATGETFNFDGKTDILIRDEGKNIFVAECMFWGGPKSLIEKVDQLLGYTSWRDTKTAIILFNRQKDFTKVLGAIAPTIEKHSNYKRTLKYTPETGFRFALHHRDDKNRELILTVLAFEVPA